MKQPYIPPVAKDPVRLALSLLRSDNPAARSALYFAAVGVACMPIDLMLRPLENRRIENAGRPTHPVLLVAGPPRSGTTLIAQYLINSLESCYFNNLTSVFPRSPLTVNAIWGRRSISAEGSYIAFYGKSRRWNGANDGLHIWDRWLGADRSAVPEALTAGSDRDIPRFFGAMQQLYALPVVNKVNRLNVCANLIASILPEARFIFVQRRPLDLAQSLLVARERIAGDLSRAYGTQHPDSAPGDPITDVCRQVRFHTESMARQRGIVPPEQLISVQYEEFCASPRGFLARVVADNAGLALRQSADRQPRKFQVSNRPKLPSDTLMRLQRTLAEMALV